jgi:hypothetical protein
MRRAGLKVRWDVIEEFSKPSNPRIYADDFYARWKKYMDIGRRSRLTLSLQQGFV